MCCGSQKSKNTVKAMNMKRLAIVVLGLLLTACTHAAGKAPTDLFGLYTSNLAGKNVTTVITSAWQQMTHPRVSPDKQWVTFGSDPSAVPQGARGLMCLTECHECLTLLL